MKGGVTNNYAVTAGFTWDSLRQTSTYGYIIFFLTSFAALPQNGCNSSKDWSYHHIQRQEARGRGHNNKLASQACSFIRKKLSQKPSVDIHLLLIVTIRYRGRGPEGASPRGSKRGQGGDALSDALLFLCGFSKRIHTPKPHPGCMLDSFRSSATHEGAISLH